MTRASVFFLDMKSSVTFFFTPFKSGFCKQTQKRLTESRGAKTHQQVFVKTGNKYHQGEFALHFHMLERNAGMAMDLKHTHCMVWSNLFIAVGFFPPHNFLISIVRVFSVHCHF